MRKLIETSNNLGPLVVCDNPNCTYEVPRDGNKQLTDYLNVPCPKCGENLLTQQDLQTYLTTMRVVKFLNKWFSWTTIFFSDKNYTVKQVSFHDGLHISDSNNEKTK